MLAASRRQWGQHDGRLSLGTHVHRYSRRTARIVVTMILHAAVARRPDRSHWNRRRLGAGSSWIDTPACCVRPRPDDWHELREPRRRRTGGMRFPGPNQTTSTRPYRSSCSLRPSRSRTKLSSLVSIRSRRSRNSCTSSGMQPWCQLPFPLSARSPVSAGIPIASWSR